MPISLQARLFCVEARRTLLKYATTVSSVTKFRALLPSDLDHPTPSVRRVTLAGKVVYDRGADHA